MSGKALQIGLLVALAVALTWPGPLVWTDAVLAAADQEAAPHIWGLWAAVQTGSPLVLETDLLAWPTGVELVLVDPANLPWFALGLAGGPASAYNATFLAGLAAMGLAGWMLAERVGGRPWLGAVVAMACPTLLANAADGQTEGFGVGWVGVQLALLLRFADSRRPRDGALAALALAWACYTGPYNGVWAALLNVGAAAVLLARAPDRGALLKRLSAVAAGAGALVVPLALALFGRRAAHLPGSGARAGLPDAVPRPELFRGGVLTGADLLDPLLPGPLTGGEAPISHTAYLGVAVVLLACAAVARDRRRWPWLAGAVGFAALSLGPRLYLAGQPLEVGGRGLLGPAGWAILAVPLLGRMTRWYRAGAVATLLLAPLAAQAPRRAAVAVGAGLIVVLDALLLAPLAWPLHHTPLPDAAPFSALADADDGALLELPPVTSATPPPGAWRDQLGVSQPLHGRPVGGTLMGLPVSQPARQSQAAVETWLRRGVLPGATLTRIRGQGFRWVAIYPRYRPMPGDAAARLEACFGPPVGRSEAAWVFDLAAAPESGCDLGGSPPSQGQPR